MRGLLSGRGIIINKGITQVRQQLPLILEDAENGLTVLSREMFAERYEKIKALDDEIKAQDLRINHLCNANELSLWLQALVDRRGFNKAAVALANKNAWILWAMASKNKA